MLGMCAAFLSLSSIYIEVERRRAHTARSCFFFVFRGFIVYMNEGWRNERVIHTHTDTPRCAWWCGGGSRCFSFVVDVCVFGGGIVVCVCVGSMLFPSCSNKASEETRTNLTLCSARVSIYNHTYIKKKRAHRLLSFQSIFRGFIVA
jgi:hypothetical protein